MAEEIIEIGPHTRMTVDECIGYVSRNSGEFQDIIFAGYDQEGSLIVRSSNMTRAEAAFILLSALDWARGV